MSVSVPVQPPAEAVHYIDLDYSIQNSHPHQQQFAYVVPLSDANYITHPPEPRKSCCTRQDWAHAAICTGSLALGAAAFAVIGYLTGVVH